MKTKTAHAVFGRKVIVFFLYKVCIPVLFNYVLKVKRFFVACLALSFRKIIPFDVCPDGPSGLYSPSVLRVFSVRAPCILRPCSVYSPPVLPVFPVRGGMISVKIPKAVRLIGR